MTEMKWNIESEYPSFTSSQFQLDISMLKALLLQFPKTDKINLDTLAKAYLTNRKVQVLLYDLRQYTGCVLSVDRSNAEAKKAESLLEDLTIQSSTLFNPFHIFLQKLSDTEFNTFIGFPDVNDDTFLLKEQRKLKDLVLTEAEENIFSQMKQTGFHEWGKLHSNLESTLKVDLTENGISKQVGIAKAMSLLRNENESNRKSAWIGIQNVVKAHEETQAAILNSLADWRHKENKIRSKAKEVHFLDQPLHDSRMTDKSLQALMNYLIQNKSAHQKSLDEMARILNKPKVDPWDLLAPGPATDKKYDLKEALSLIKNAFSKIHPDFGNFVQLMIDNQWIETRVLDTKSTGAYCCDFKKSRTPRVFMTYNGSAQDMFTLAHELGHAFHSWVLREAPVSHSDYPMTLAESASNVGEFALYNYLLETGGATDDILWFHHETSAAYLLNIPMRFEFEKTFYEKRLTNPVSTEEIINLQIQTWNNWFTDKVSQPDPYFWAHKLHFYITQISFYNFPYSFGYLFAKSLFEQKKHLGQNFWPTYLAVLKDTGIMTVEDLIQKHFKTDLTGFLLAK